MSRPTRFAAQQWGWGRSVPDPWQLADQIQSLRARVEALETTQHAHADLLHLSGAEQDRMAQERAKPAAWRPLETEITYGSDAAADAAQILHTLMVVEGTFDHGGETYRYKANATPERDPAMAELRAASAEARPVGGLVERVAEAIADADERIPTDGSVNIYSPEARAAIREVAKWLRDRYPKSPESGAVAFNLCQEADRG
jgi:hypothetical protein